MENSSNKEPPQGKMAGINLFILGFALIATLVAGVAIGLLINRPVVVQDTSIVATATPNPNSQTVVQAASESISSTSQTEESGNTSLPTPTIMDFVLSDARHFLGSADAPVTLVEFSDFK